MILNASRSIDRLETYLKTFSKKPITPSSEDLEKLSQQFKDLHENLKLMDYSKSLSILKHIGGSLESFFSTSLKKEDNSAVFCLLLLNSLEFYSKIFSSPDTHNKKFHKKVFSIFTKVSALLLSKDSPGCFSEVFSIKISPTPIEGSLLILKTLANLTKGKFCHFEEKDLETLYFYFSMKINENLDFRASRLTETSVICCEKFIKVLEFIEEFPESSLIFNAVCEKRETLKENFLLSCKIVLTHSGELKKWGFESEDMLKDLFGVMTRFLVKFTSTHASYQQFYDVPVIITHLLLAEFPDFKSLPLFQTLKSLVMQEIFDFYSEKFQESIQIGIEDLLLSNFLFEENSKDQQDLWDQILSKALDNLSSIDPLIKLISSKIAQNIDNFSYLSTLNQLMNSILSTTKKPIEEPAFFQMISEIIKGIKSSSCLSIKEMLFQLLTFILQFAKLSQQHQFIVLNSFFNEILLHDPENSSFFPGILSNILKTAEIETIEYVLSIVTDTKDQNFTELLVVAVTKLIFGSDEIDDVLEKLIRTGFLMICVKRLENQTVDQQALVENWTSTFEILKIIRVHRRILFEFKVDSVVRIFRGFLKDLKQIIIAQTTDNLIEIVMNSDGYVKYPPGCVLIVEFLLSCDTNNEKYKTLMQVLTSTKEFFIFAEKHFLSTVLFHIKAFPENPTIDILSSLLVDSMKMMINLKDFSDLVALMTETGSNRRYFLLKTLRNALSMKNKVLSFSKSLILSAKHAIEYQPSKKSPIFQSKAFSVYFWVFLSEDSHILDLYLSQEAISLTLSSRQLQVRFNNVMHAETEPLHLDNWYLVVVTSNSVKTDRKCSVFIATTSEQVYRKEFTIRSSSSNDLQRIKFSSAGVSLKTEAKPTVNRVKNLNICGKVFGFKEVLEISKISWRYSLMAFPSHEAIDLKTVSELQDSALLTWEEVSARCSKKTSIFENSQIFDVVRVYSPTRLLYELCHRTEDLKELFEIFNICERIICFSNYFFIADDFFTHFLGFYFNQKLVDVRINEVFLDIIKSAPDKQNKVLFDSYLHNTKSMFLLQQSKKRMEEVIQKFINLKPFSKVNLMKFCRLINGLTFESCVTYLKVYLFNNIEKNVDEVVAVLIHLVNVDNLFMIRCFLEVFIQDSIQLNIDSKLFVVLLYIIDTKHDTELQICLFKTLCCKISYEKDEDKPEKIANLVSQILPDKISNDLFEFLVKEGLQSTRYKRKIRVAMVNIALISIRHIKDSSQFFFLNEILSQNPEKIFEFIYQTDFFPSWIIFAVKGSGYTKELIELSKTILTPVINMKNQDIGKLQEIFKEVPNTEIFMHLLTSLKDHSIEKYFQIFCILWEFPSEIMTKNVEKILEILKFLRNDINFMVSVEKSIEIKYVSNKLIDSEDNKSCLIAGEFVKFYLHLIKTHKQNKELFLIIQDLQSFLESPSIQFFSKYFQTSKSEFKSKESCESYLSIFLFYSVLKNFYKNPVIWEDFIQNYIKKSHILKKISGIMNENLSKSLFYRISISKSTAVIPTGALSMSSLENSSINELDDFCFGFDYDALKENSKICEILYEQSQTPILNIIEKSNPTWKVVFNSLAIAAKNYSKLDSRWRVGIFCSYCEVYDQFDSAYIQRTLKQIFEDPWFLVYSEETERERFKVEYDLRNFMKTYEKSSEVLFKKKSTEVTLRQRYDKLFRWVFLKSKKPKNRAELFPSLPEMKKAQTEVCKDLNRGFQSSSVPRYSVHETMHTDPFALFTCNADYIKVQGACFGKITISKQYFEFTSANYFKPLGGIYSFSSLDCSMVQKNVRHIWLFSEIGEVVLRKFIHQASSFEVVLASGRSFLFNVFREETRREIMNLMQAHKQVLVYGKSLQTEGKSLTEDWKKGRMSNFEYLMNLNKIAGRSLNDIYQYPVFPWVVTDFSQQVANFEDLSFRNLAFPVSAQTEKAREDGISKYLSWQDDLVPPFIYGSHYSNSGIVLHYLLRLEPFTTQAKALQSGCFDVGDRLFFSLDKAWSSTQCGGGDCKELVPELFYQPWTLNSCSEQVFGCTYQGQEIIHLQVPVWAVSNWDFIKKHRLLLESSVVSQGLPAWIDLVFGVKQRGEKALQACNVFCPETYEDFFALQKNRISNNDLQSYIEKIYHFGQTPSQVFKDKAHGKKEDLGCSENLFGKGVFAEVDFAVFDKEERKKGSFVAGFILKSLVVSIRLIDKNFYISRFLLKSIEDSAYLTFTEQVLKHFNYSKFKESSPDIQKILTYSCKTFTVFKEKLLLSGLHKSGSVLVHTLKGELVQTLFFHSEVVSSVNSSESLVFSGSLDGSLVSWTSTPEGFQYNSCFFGHSSGVSQIEVLESYSVIVSSSVLGVLLVHDTRNSECLVKLDSKCDVFKLSDLGFICTCQSTFVTFFHITGKQIYQEDLHCPTLNLEFSLTGDYCLVVMSDQILIKDPTDQRSQKSLKISDVFIAKPHPQNKTLAVWKNLKKLESVFCIGKIDGKSFRKHFMNNIT